MLILAIDTALDACSAALLDTEAGALLARESLPMARGHAEALMPLLARLRAAAALDFAKLDRIVVTTGPGSFTGLRVGLAAARALGLAWGAEVIGYPTFALLAAMAAAERGEQALAVAMTGGHGEWFVERFAGGRSVAPLASLTPAQAGTVPEPLVAGSQAEALVALRGHGDALPLWPDARRFPLLGIDVFTRDLSLLYGRAPDARLPGGATP